MNKHKIYIQSFYQFIKFTKIKTYLSEKLLIVFFFLIFCVFSHIQTTAQILQNDFCGSKSTIWSIFRNEPWAGNNDFLTQFLDSCGYNYLSESDLVLYRVPVKLWIHTDNKGKGGASESDIKKFFNSLNYFNSINSTGFQYYVSEIVKIKKKKKMVLNYLFEAPVHTTIYRTRGVVNVHIVDKLVRKRIGEDVSYRGTFNMINDAVIITRKISSTGLTHEVGHYFGLYHPHRNSRFGKLLQESVSRERKNVGFKRCYNCETKGDKLCDTPAEPILSEYVDINCNFTGHELTDKWGDFYKPLTNNIMSYPTYQMCRNEFTKGQISLMLYTASKMKTAKKWLVKDASGGIIHSNFDFDRFEPDDLREMAGVILFDTIQNHSFHKILTNRKHFRMDSVDWSKIQLDFDSDIYLYCLKGKYAFPEIRLVIFNDQEKILADMILTSHQESPVVELKNLKQGKYFVKVVNLQCDDFSEISDYNILVKNKPNTGD